jgi:hypothetical protein
MLHTYRLFAFAAAGLIAVATVQSVSAQPSSRPTAKAIAARDSALASLVAATPKIVAELKDLNPRQRAAVLSLVVLTNAAVGYERTTPLAKQAISRRVLEQVAGLVSRPPAASAMLSVMQGCLSYSIAYASAMAACHKEGKREEDCPDAWGPAGQEISCMMKTIDSMKGFIGGLFGPLPGPKPFPY